MDQPSQGHLDLRSQALSAVGPWPFTTRVALEIGGVIRQRTSRSHRKRVSEACSSHSASPDSWARISHRLNLWIGSVFAIGALLFAVASGLALMPAIAGHVFDQPRINAIYFAGSIPFTIAAWLQLYQAANAGELDSGTVDSDRRFLFGWFPHRIGWTSSALQFMGTVLFNLNTLDAMLPTLNWFQQDLLIWLPDFAGSVLFLVSGYLAFIETCHRYWAWKPRSLAWWIVFINLAGCVGFMSSAVFAWVSPGAANPEFATFATMLTLQGAVCFLVGALLMLPEAGIGSA
ncbi:hypothetical protein K227x_03580 [Rubripirellula lacrimiformis]|uniref:YrhK domain-containing protein n=1 Tax=Rubripirellula lacrimiformis TaxID=1930273 RepID=A0A517N4C7_9BACT|nr:hypothetical protein [Rubripirellula lacrimiformis]QDT01987.1 hypothetical protein K227x_03580 [Rubripirellula lacrimiformis]